MGDKRQKNQLELAFMEEDRGEAPKGLPEGTESSAGKRGTESPAITEQWMEEVWGRENCKQALKRVRANKGSPGVDGMTVHDLPGYLIQHWPAIREQLLSGTYEPQPVERVEIPADDSQAFGRLLREWSMRGHSCRAFDAVFAMLKDEHRAEREASYAPRFREVRQLYPEMYAPVNPGFRIIGRPPPNFVERIRACVRGGTPGRPAPTPVEKLRAALHL